MKQILKRWTGIGLRVASMLTVGGVLTLQSGANMTAAIVPQQVLMADGGGDRPMPCPPFIKCLNEDAII